MKILLQPNLQKSYKLQLHAFIILTVGLVLQSLVQLS